MAKFIKLHGRGIDPEFYVNFNMIIAIEKDNGLDCFNSRIYESFEDFWRCKETPEEILKLIEEAQNGNK